MKKSTLILIGAVVLIGIFAVSAYNGLVNKQVQAEEEFKVRGVPAFFVNEQYEINLSGFSDSTSTNDFIKRYVDAVTFLIKK